jgi:hypothetical protein
MGVGVGVGGWVCWAGLILGERALAPKSNAAGKFYIVTDGKTHPDGNQVSRVYVYV